MIKLLDTFAGVGGFHLALERAIWKENMECVGFSEIDKFAKQTYLHRFPWTTDFGDITKIDIQNLPDFDLLTGGFPCQDVSVAWKQNLDGGRTVLVEYLLQMLEIKKPKYFVFENVKWLVWKRFKEFYNSILERIKEAWYIVQVQVLNTKDYGIPQNRERVFMVGSLDFSIISFNFPYKQKLKIFLKDILEDEVDEKYYLSDKFIKMLTKHSERHEWKGSWFWVKYKTWQDGEYANCLRANAALCPTDNILKLNNPTHSNNRIYSDKGISPTLNTMQWWHRQPKILLHSVNLSWRWQNGNVYGWDVSPTLTTNKWEWIKIINATKKWYLEAKEWDSVLLDQPNSKTKRGRVKRGISSTLMCSDNNWVVVENYRIRKLTPVECERLQGFPDWWSSDVVSNSQAYKQMWNSITVDVVEKIFINLLK